MSKANRQTKSKDPMYAGTTPDDKRNSRSGAWRALILAGFAFVAIRPLGQVSRNFPGAKSELISPDRRYVIQNVDHNEEHRHFLFLKNKVTGKSRQVYEYGRSASIVWSPDSRHFAVDDSAGSDPTETSIFSVDETTPKIDVQKEILDKRKDVPGGHHEYFYVAYWIDARRVVLYHWGYGAESPRSFCECYVYTLNAPVRKCTRQPKDSDNVCERTIP